MVNLSEDRSDWRELCKQAATEKDFGKLLELTDEILRLLNEERDGRVQLAS